VETGVGEDEAGERGGGSVEFGETGLAARKIWRRER